MKKINTFLLISIGIVFTFCNKKVNDPGNTDANNFTSEQKEQLFKSFQVLTQANDEIINIGETNNVSPREAMAMVVPTIKDLPDVEDVYFLDSSYLRITTKGGYQTVLSIDVTDQNGLSLYRGGLSGTAALTAFEGSSKRKMTNNKVLLYAACHNDFYSGNEYQWRVVDAIEEGEVDVDVTVLKDEECTPEILETFDQYGLVILDTHGDIDGVLTGIKFDLNKAEITGTVDAFLNILKNKIGSKNLELFIQKKLSFGKAYRYDPSQQNQQVWNTVKQPLIKYRYSLRVTSKGIREIIPDLSQTIVFANCCYSAFRATSYTNGTFSQTFDPVQLAWMSRNPIAFYGYEAATKGVSYEAPDNYCKANADTLIYGFFHYGDSTGAAHLFNSSKINQIPWGNYLGWKWNDGNLKFNQYGQENWCYKCGKNFIDDRDNQEYETVCIGKQVWMARNLNWAGAGTCYDNNPSSCKTFGRLYTWTEVTGGVGSNSNPSGVKGACPKGWHVPSKSEWLDLLNHAGGVTKAGSKLRANSNLWADGTKGTDDFGFSALPAGRCDFPFDCYNEDDEFNFWTSSGSGTQDYSIFFLNAGIDFVSELTEKIDTRMSCRCVKD
jgi:uncharacterized protein (TIGR02145 family)